MHVLDPSQTWLVAAFALNGFFDPVAASPQRQGLRCAGLIRAGRSLFSVRFPPSGVTGHHPYDPFTRVIPARLLPRRRSGMGHLGGVSFGGSERAEFAGARDRRRAVLNAQFAVQGALMVFTVFSET